MGGGLRQTLVPQGINKMSSHSDFDAMDPWTRAANNDDTINFDWGLEWWEEEEFWGADGPDGGPLSSDPKSPDHYRGA